MGRYSLVSMLAAFIFLAAYAFITLSGCAGNTDGQPVQQPGGGVSDPAGISLEQALADLEALQPAGGVDPGIFEQLKDELASQLAGMGAERFAARAPWGPSNIVDDLAVVVNGDNTFTLTWTYRNHGDYDLNSEVNISDLTVLGTNFLTLGPFVPYSQIWAVDGDGNGEINIADITAIGQGFTNNVMGYIVQYSETPEVEESWAAIASVGFQDATSEDGWMPRFSAMLPIEEFDPCGTFRVVPYGNEGMDDLGVPSIPVGTFVGEEGIPPPEELPELGTISGTVTLPGALDNIAQVSIPGMDPFLTGADGSFVISGLEPAGRLAVTFSAVGYMDNTRIFEVVADQQRDYTVEMSPREDVVTIDADEPNQILSASGASLLLPPGALVDAAGNPLGGNVDVQLSLIDASNPQQLGNAPGDFSALQMDNSIVQLESLGMIEVFVDDGSGGAADLAPGQSASMKLPIPAEMQGDAPETIGLYSFDEVTGQWIEEGTATKDLSGMFYEATVTHFSTWNWDKPYLRTKIHVEVVDENGDPLQGAFVVAEGVDYSGYTEGWTNKNGIACFYVRKDSLVDIQVNYYGLESGLAESVATPVEASEICDFSEGAPVDATLAILGGSQVKPPQARVSVQMELDSLTAYFDASESFDPNGEIVSYEWLPGDYSNNGQWISTGAEPLFEYTYAAEGVYTASLRVTDDQGLTMVRYFAVSLVVEPPVVVLSANPTRGPAPLTVSFDASGSYDLDGEIVKFEWDWDGEINGWEWFDSGTDPTAEHTYDNPGHRSVAVRVTDDDGLSSVGFALICVKSA
ncbi:PKD domain-containing protein [bacterium]|nr:PKD domain-containing protein [bacterium]